MWTTAAAQPSQHCPRASVMAASMGQIAASCCATAVGSPSFTLPKAGICCHCHSDSKSFRRSVITSQSAAGAEARGVMLSWLWKVTCSVALANIRLLNSLIQCSWKKGILQTSITLKTANALVKVILLRENAAVIRRLSQMLKVKTKWPAILRDKAEWYHVLHFSYGSGPLAFAAMTQVRQTVTKQFLLHLRFKAAC